MSIHLNGSGKVYAANPTTGLAFDTDAVAIARPYIVKGVCGPGDLIALYGAPGSGKTFLALDLAYAVAAGRTFFGRRTRQFAVLYIGLEGHAGLANRMAGAASVHGSAGNMIARLTLPVSLSAGDSGDAGVKTIVAAHERLTAHAKPVGLIIIDTLARAMAGGDENSAQDMGRLIARTSEITQQTRAAVLVVHHSGKDAAKGMRGSSALYAACDAVIQIDESRTVALDKAKDGETGPLGNFALSQVILGKDDDGDPITTCVVEPGASAPKTIKLTPQTRAAHAVLLKMRDDGETAPATFEDLDLTNPKPTKLPTSFLEKRWRERCAKKRLTGTGEAAAERQAYGRACDKLAECGVIGRYGDFVWLIDGAETRVTKSVTLRKPGDIGLGQRVTSRDTSADVTHGQPADECDIQRHHPIGVSFDVTPVEPPSVRASLPDLQEQWKAHKGKPSEDDPP